LIAGGSGIGKSRIAYETQHIFHLLPLENHGVSNELRKLFDQNLLFFSVSFDNGTRFCKEEVDCTPSVRLGARLAIVSGLVDKFSQPLPSLFSRKMEFLTVLQAILQRFRKEKGIDEQSVVPIIIHLDEYQKYISEYEVYAKLPQGSDPSRTFFKSLLQEIGAVMTPRDTPVVKQLGHYFIIPIITGTSEVDLQVLLTDHRRVARTLKPLSKDGAKKMFYDKYEYRRSKDYTDSQKAELIKSLEEFTGSDPQDQRTFQKNRWKLLQRISVIRCGRNTFFRLLFRTQH